MSVVLSAKLKKQGYNELCIILHKNYKICNLVWNSNQLLIRNLYDKISKDAIWIRISIVALILVISVAYLVDATYNPFLYFRF